MTALPTVRIRSGDSYIIINESDLLPEHILWAESDKSLVSDSNIGIAPLPELPQPAKEPSRRGRPPGIKNR